MKKPKLAINMPPPRELTPEEYTQATEEARELRSRLDEKMRGMETFDPRELYIRLK